MKKLLLIIFLGIYFQIIVSEESEAYQSTYDPNDSGDIFIKDARILTGTRKDIL